MANIRDVAKAANVSVATVSAVINGNRPVSDELKVRVLKAIDELGYRPKPARPSNAKSLAYLTPAIQHPVWGHVTKGVHDAAYTRGYHVIVCNLEMDPAKSLEYQQFLVDRDVSGFLITTPYSDEVEEAVSNLEILNIPFVIVDAPLRWPNYPLVAPDRVAGTQNGFRYLLSLGHESIAVITKSPSSVSQVRIQSIAETVNEEKALGKTVRYKVYGTRDLTRAEGEKAAQALLEDEEFGATAVMCLDDVLALGVMDIFYNEGIAIPDDLSVLTVSDTYANLVRPRLSAVSSPTYEMGWRATELLLSYVENERVSDHRIFLTENLVVRESTGHINPKNRVS